MAKKKNTILEIGGRLVKGGNKNLLGRQISCVIKL